MTDPITAPLQLTIHPLPDAASKAVFWSEDAPSFSDILDVINPLQHIPIISTLYQALTGDTQSPAAKIIGGGIFGGPIGLIASIFDTVIEQETGKDTAGNLMAAITGEDIPALQVASNEAQEGLTIHQLRSYNAYLQAQSLLA
jgi:hypothetical protein